VIANVKPYSLYKDSGVPWLEEVPEHWEVLRTRYLFREVDLRTTTGTETHLSMSQRLGLVPSSEMQERRLVSESYIGAKICEPGDLVLNRLKAHLGVFALASQEGLVSPDYTVFRPISPNVLMSFYEPLLKSPAFRHELRTRAKGLVEGFWRLYTDDFYEIRLPVPPVDEQSAIVRFLGHADRRIRRYIRAKQKLIKLLDEQRQMIVERALTSEGEGNSKSWQPIRLKYVASVQTGVTLGKNYGSQTLAEYPYLRVANVQAGRLNLSEITTVRVPEAEARGTTLRDGDVLMTEGGDIDKLGRGCVWQGEIKDCLHQNHIFAVRPRENALLAEYLVMLLASSHGRRYFEITAKKTTNLASTNSTTLGRLPLLLPDIEEQHKILSRIKTETSVIEVARDRAEREIGLLREYRTRLIADVVTGKLDVRKAAAGLPDEVEETDELPLADELEGAEDPELTSGELAEEEVIV
jgi:type I restriction enzyme, S subunit